MLAFFRNIQITSVIPLAVYVLITHAAALAGVVHPEPAEMGASGLFYDKFFGQIDDNQFWSALLAMVLVFFQAIQVNSLADDFRLMPDRNWIPGMLFVLASALIPDFLFLSPPLVAVTFIPVSMRRLFKIYKANSFRVYVFDAGFWVVLASLFYPSAAYLLLAVIVGILVMGSISARDYIILAAGVFVPSFLAWLFWFWYDSGTLFLQTQLNGIIGLYHFAPQFDTRELISGILLLLLIFTVILNYGNYFAKKLIQTQKCISILYWFLFVGALSIFLQKNASYAHLLLIMPSVGLFLAFTFTGIKNRMIAEIMHLCILGLVLFVQYYPV